MIKVGAHVLSEYGNLIADLPNKGVQKQFDVLQKQFYNCTPKGRGILLTSFMKMAHKNP